MNLLPFAVIWAGLVLAMIAMIVYRRRIARAEEPSLHVLQVGALSQQVSVGQKLEQIDRWGKLLTVVVVVYGLALVGVYMYTSFVQASTHPLG